MKTKTIIITVGHKVGLPNFSNKSIEITQEVTLDEGDSVKVVRDKLYSTLDRWVKDQVKIIEKVNKNDNGERQEKD